MINGYHMEDYLNGIDEDLWWSIRDGPYRTDNVETVGTTAENENINVLKVKCEANDKRCMRELRVHFLMLCIITSMDATQLNKSWTNWKKNSKELKELRKVLTLNCYLVIWVV